MNLSESTKKYYAEKSNRISQIIDKKLIDDNYNGFINVPISKNMIQLKYDVGLTIDGHITNDEEFEMIVDEAIYNLIYSSCIKQTINEEISVFLCNQMVGDSAENLTNFIDESINLNTNKSIEDINKIRYMYVGEPHLKLIDHILTKKTPTNNYLGNYKNKKHDTIQIYYVDQLTDIYLTSGPYVDLSKIDVKYNEYFKYNRLNPSTDFLFETIDDSQKNALITLKCLLGDVRIIKLNTIFDCSYFSLQWSRRKKLQRILKNDINI